MIYSLSNVEIPTTITPETIAIKKEMIDNLSREAKVMILITLNAPSEILNTYKVVSRPKLFKFIKTNLGWSWKTIERTKKEIRQLMREF